MIAWLQQFSLYLAAAAGASMASIALLAFDALIDDPAVVREARREYIQITKHEAVEAKLETAQRLLKLERETAAHIKRERKAEQESLAIFERELIEANIRNKGLKDELDRLENRPGREAVPTLRDLGLRLRN